MCSVFGFVTCILKLLLITVVTAALILGTLICWRENKARQKRERRNKALLDQIAQALRRVETGQAEQGKALLEQLGTSGSGDAWRELAMLQSNEKSPLYDLPGALESFQKAAESSEWITGNFSSDCRDHVEDLQFLGVAALADYAAFYQKWMSNSWVPGNRREIELAWMFAHGKGVKRDDEEAWYWLAMGQCRCSQRSESPPALPDCSYTELRETLQCRLGDHKRKMLEEKARRVAYEEFVASH